MNEMETDKTKSNETAKNHEIEPASENAPVETEDAQDSVMESKTTERVHEETDGAIDSEKTKESEVVKVPEEESVAKPKNKSRRNLVIALLTTLLIATVLLYYNRNQIFQPAPPPDEHAGHEQTTTMENMPPGSVMIDPSKQQLIGLKLGEADLVPLTRTLRAVGKITFDETKVVRIHPKVEGWVENVYVNFTGMRVQKGQPLLSIYSPDLVSTQQEFLLSLKAKKTLGKSDFPEIASSANSLYAASRKRLELWDIPNNQINEIERRGEIVKALTLFAESGGYVLTKNAFQRQKITPDTELYSIADLSTVWVIADIYEYEMQMIRVGQAATMNLAYYPGETFTGKVTYIYPQLDAQTRTMKARIEFPNRNLKLKPDMFANVDFQIVYPRQVSVPEEAVLDSGAEQIVFVALGDGYFEPRKVQLGAKVDDRYIILSGLQAGEKIVISGNYMVDSESRLKSSTAGMGSMPGMKMDEKK
jgi:multidrug efflux pump subunit AcrA (membrane-fusion protein)